MKQATKSFTMKFQSILIFIYRTLKLSGFLLSSVVFSVSRQIESSKSFRDIILFTVSVLLSLSSNYNVSDLPMEKIIHSTLVKIGVNYNGKLTVLTPFIIKISNMIYDESFMEILAKLEFVHKKVFEDLLQLYLI